MPPKGYKMSDEQRMNISIAKTGKTHKGSAHSDETKRKMSDAKKGKTRPKNIPYEIERILSKSIILENGCKEWTGRKTEDGYGVLGGFNKYWLAHRYLWFLTYGEIEKGKCICHHCDNPACVNIDHLFIGTHSDNMQDMYNKNRHIRVSFKGEDNGYSKLKNEQVLSIRGDNRHNKEIAKDYGVHFMLIHKIKTNQIWRHI